MKRGELRRKSPLRAKSKRAAPTRPKRICHERMKPKESDAPTADQRRYWAWLREQGCVVTNMRDGGSGALALTLHHVTSDGFKRIARSHWRVVPLRADMHQTVWNNTDSVEAIGHAAFADRWGVDLYARADELRAEWERLGCP